MRIQDDGRDAHITKGSCTRTETKLTWNQQGPQGLPGAKGDVGAKGETGAAGAKGDNGAAGTKGDSGINGQNLYAVDATGKTLGIVTNSSGFSVFFLSEGFIWNASAWQSNLFNSTGGNLGYYQDSSCSKPYINLDPETVANPQFIFMDQGLNQAWDSSDKANRSSGNPQTFAGRSVFSVASGVCTALSGPKKTSHDNSGEHLYDAVEVQKPTYTAPISIVQK